MRNLNRRLFLKAGAISLALPALESCTTTQKATQSNTKAKAIVCIGTHLGWYRKGFYPEETGYDYKIPELIEPIADHKNDFTIFSGLDHRAPNGHKAWTNFLSGKKPDTYSLDQIIADKIGQKNRFPSVRLTAGAGESAETMSFTKRGIPLPVIQRPSVFYKQMFLSKADIKLSEYMLKSGKSALDYVLEDAKRLQKTVTTNDNNKLEEYFDSMRSVEKRINQQLNDIDAPVVTTDYKLPNYDPITPNLQMEASTLMYDLMALAIQNQSTKVLTLYIHGLGQVFSIDGQPLKTGYHGLTHHGNDPVMIRDLMKIEKTHFKCLNGFLNHLKEKKDNEGNPLLNSTIVLVGTGMGDASRHDNGNLPTLVAGGGFKHGRHIHTDKTKDNLLLGDLYITLQQQMGIETESFSNANRNFNHILV